ncbi:MAG: hypothetical protein JOZ39_07365, partial [Chloroflexi bacterium]|nr:hypothetical protein [Chloroflexota bacterium]
DGTEKSFVEGLASTLLHPPSREMIDGRLALAQLPGAAEVSAAMRNFGRRMREDPNLQQQFQIRDRLPKYTKPMKILWGKEDRFAPIKDLAYPLQEMIPQIPIEFIENAGHQCQHDAPEEVNRRIIEFLHG